MKKLIFTFQILPTLAGKKKNIIKTLSTNVKKFIQQENI